MKQVINPYKMQPITDRPVPPQTPQPAVTRPAPRRSIGALRTTIQSHNDILQRIRAREEALHPETDTP